MPNTHQRIVMTGFSDCSDTSSTLRFLASIVNVESVSTPYPQFFYTARPHLCSAGAGWNSPNPGRYIFMYVQSDCAGIILINSKIKLSVSEHLSVGPITMNSYKIVSLTCIMCAPRRVVPIRKDTFSVLRIVKLKTNIIL